jgi:hypothetical protein
MNARAIVLMLCITLLMFGIDLLGVRSTSGSGARRIFALAAIPLCFAFVLVLIRRWRQFQ